MVTTPLAGMAAAMANAAVAADLHQTLARVTDYRQEIIVLWLSVLRIRHVILELPSRLDFSRHQRSSYQ
jgi:hypothetical protein